MMTRTEPAVHVGPAARRLAIGVVEVRSQTWCVSRRRICSSLRARVRVVKTHVWWYRGFCAALGQEMPGLTTPKTNS